MIESYLHKKLVQLVYNYVSNQLSDNEKAIIQMDDSETKVDRTSEGFIPDISFTWQDVKIIGEAKTSDDFSKKHSKKQFESYIQDLNCYNANKSFLAVAVPFDTRAEAVNYFVNLKTLTNIQFKIIILTNLNDVKIL